MSQPIYKVQVHKYDISLPAMQCRSWVLLVHTGWARVPPLWLRLSFCSSIFWFHLYLEENYHFPSRHLMELGPKNSMFVHCLKLQLLLSCLLCSSRFWGRLKSVPSRCAIDLLPEGAVIMKMVSSRQTACSATFCQYEMSSVLNAYVVVQYLLFLICRFFFSL